MRRSTQLRGALVVAIGGALGAVARYGIASLVTLYWKGPLPLGTLIINISGSFVIGLLLPLYSDQSTVSPGWRLLLAVGFIGAYTTFATFELETLRLIETGRLFWAATYVASSVLCGLFAVLTGAGAARWLGLTSFFARMSS